MVQRQVSSSRSGASGTRVKSLRKSSRRRSSAAAKTGDSLEQALNDFNVQKLVEVDESEDVSKFMADPTVSAPTDFEEYAKLFDDVVTLNRNFFDTDTPIMLKPGKIYFLVSCAWADLLVDWQRKFEEAFEDHLMGRVEPPADWTPGSLTFNERVDNSELVEHYTKFGLQLCSDLNEYQNYFIVDENAWRTLIERFGGGPEISRVAFKAARSSQGEIDTRDLPVKVVVSNDITHFHRAVLEKGATVKQVLNMLCRRYGLDHKGARIWDFYMGRCHACLIEPTMTMVEYDITDDQHIFIELVGPNGKFELDPDNPPIPSALPSSTLASLNSRSFMNGVGRTGTYGRSAPAEPGLVGLFNLRNTCYMNSTLQCLSNIPQLRDYFYSDGYVDDLNDDNPLGTGGRLAHAFADLIKSLWDTSARLPRAISPGDFKAILDDVHPDFAGFMQHDAQELLSYLLDDLHEDVNRVRQKPYTEPVEANGRPDEEVAEEALAVYKQRNDSMIADLCTGMLLSKVSCPRPGCSHVSVTFDPYMVLPLPVEAGPLKSRMIEVTVVPSHSPLDRKVYRVESPVSGPITLLRNIIAHHSNIPVTSLLLCEVLEHKIIRVIAEAMKIETLSNQASVYAFENVDTMKHLDMLHGEYTQWARMPLYLTQEEMLIDENYLGYIGSSSVTGTQQGAAPKGRRAPPVGPPPAPPPLSPQAMLAGIDHIKLTQRKHSACEQIGVSIVSKGPDVSTLSGRKALAMGKYASPFQKGQIWLGHLEPYSFATTRLIMRAEVVHVELVDNEYFRVYILFDVSRIIPKSKNALEQETKLMVGEYVPSEIVEETRAGGNRRKLGRRDGSGSSSDNKEKLKEGMRKSLNRFSPRNVSKALFSNLKKRNSKHRGDSTAGIDDDEAESKAASETELRSVEEEHEMTGEEGSSLDGTGSEGGDNASQTSSKKDEPLVHNMGEVYLEAGPWKAVYYSFDEPSYLKRSTVYKIRASVDEYGSMFYGKFVYEGYQSTETMTFVLRLAPPEMAPLMDLNSPQSHLQPVDRKLSLNNSRSFRVMNSTEVRVGNTTKTFGCLDPGIFVVDYQLSESQAYWMVIDFYVDLYNDFMRDGVGKLEDPPEELSRLPPQLTREDMVQAVEVRYAARNYELKPNPRDPKNGKTLDPSSDDLFFYSKSSFTRIVNRWDVFCPLIQLFQIMDTYLELKFGRGHMKSEEDMRIEDCLELLCSTEKLSEEDSWYCSNCKVHTEATKTLQIWSFPPVLVLHLKRFAQEEDGYFSEKLQTQINFPLEGLDLRQYALDPESQEAAIYDLCCVTNHYGGIGSGHYTCYTRHEPDGTWHEFDDDAVFPVRNLAAICSTAAYVLFYLRRDFRPARWGEPREQVIMQDSGSPDYLV